MKRLNRSSRPIPHYFNTITYQEHVVYKKKTQIRHFLLLLCIMLIVSITAVLATHLRLQRKQSTIVSTAPTQAPLVTICPNSIYSQIDYSYALLVNSTHPIACGYTPNLVTINSIISPEKAVCLEGAEYANPVALQALKQMLSDAIFQGCCGWNIRAAYRSQEQQQKIWDETYDQYQKNYDLSTQQAYHAVLRRVEMPGYSEHETGLAFDLGIDSASSASAAQCDWLREHCTAYGFIIRYTDDKENLTGIGNEPWHIRYVGSPHAERMKNENLCLEEYTVLYVP